MSIPVAEILDHLRKVGDEYSHEAADALERLEAELAAARTALKPFARYAEVFEGSPDHTLVAYWQTAINPTVGDCRRGRAAMGPSAETK